MPSGEPEVTGAHFDSYYFAHCCGRPYARTPEWLAFFAGIADRIVSDIHPSNALDAGCAFGFLVEALRARGVEASGIDLSPYAIENVDESVKSFCRIGSVADSLGRSFDLIISIEVLEHVEHQAAERAVANFCASTDDVLFSSTPLDYREPTHVNVQPPEYWAEQFARHGFFRDPDCDASFITPWAVRFRRINEPVHTLVRRYERRYWLLQHETSETRTYSRDVQDKLAQEEREGDNLRFQLASRSAALEESLRTIALMESSRFWKLRNAWLWLRRAFRRRRHEE